MPESAQVRSIDSVDAFRSSLIVFHAKARPVLDEISSDLRRTQLWLETDRLLHWQREAIRRTRVLEAAQQALLSARIATFRDATPVEQNAVHAARRSLEEAQDKLHTLKRWIREFGPRTEPLARQVGSLDSVLTQDVPRAIAWLTQVVRLLEDYADTGRPQPPAASGIAPPAPNPAPNPDPAPPASLPPESTMKGPPS